MPNRKSGAEDLQTLVQQIYRSGMAADSWHVTLRQFRSLFQSSVAALTRYDYGAKDSAVLYSDGTEEVFVKSYKDYYHGLNPWVLDGRVLALGDVSNGERQVPERLLVKTEYYNDWLRPQDLFYSMRAVIYVNGPEILVAALARPRALGPFDRSELSLCQNLVPHFQEAIKGFHRLRQLGALSRCALHALDTTVFGIAVFDANGRSIFINQVGRELLEEGDGLRLRADGLHATHRYEEKRLRDALLKLTSGSGNSMPGLATMAISRPSARRPLSLTICPLYADDPMFQQDRPTVMAVFADPEREFHTDEDSLRRLYGLTRAEARLAGCLVRGDRIEEAAEHLKVSTSTARTHLKHIFSKTGTKRQTDLVRLLLSGLAGTPLH